MTTLREFVTEIVVLSVTAVAGFVTLLFPNTSLIDAYRVWSFGVIVTTATLVLKRELQSRLDERIEIYRLAENIEDEELRERGNVLIRECKYGLEQLTKGTFTGGISDVIGQAIIRMTKAKTRVQATHLVANLELLHAWDHVPGYVNYYEANLAAIKRGVEIERIFIIDKDLMSDPSTGKLTDEKGLKILKQQSRDGIDVTVTWKHDLPNADLLEDFIIFDSSVITIAREGVTGNYESVTVTRGRNDLLIYSDKFATIKFHGESLNRLLGSHGVSVDDTKTS